MAIYYLVDPLLQAQKNKRGETHYPAYIPEILSRLGVPFCAWHPNSPAFFAKGDVLLTGKDTLSPETVSKLSESVKKGLTLIGFSTGGSESLFGINTEKTINQPNGEFSLTGYFAIDPSVKKFYMNVPEDQPKLPVFSPVVQIRTAKAEILGNIQANGESYAGFLRYRDENGTEAFYFAFDLPQTLLISAQGKPVTEPADGWSVGRLPMARVTPLDYNTEIAYGDYYLYILQNIFADLGYAMLHRLPLSENGKVPDFALYYAGDEDACDPAISTDAAAFMAGRGLPYHINLMPFGENMEFRLSPAQFDELRKNGCELALHYDMTGNSGKYYIFSEENFRRQYRAYLQHFGVPSISTVGHCLTHNGWAERMRFLEKIGVRGDFERCGEYDPVDINAFDKYGFAFGTAFPSFPYDDAEHNNRKIDLAEAPIAYYEPRIGEKYPDGADRIARCLEYASYFGRMINLFTHPHYLTDLSGYNSAMTKAALDRTLAYIKEKGKDVIHSAPDRICEFWRGRSRSSVLSVLSVISETSGFENTQNYYVASECEALIVRIPVDDCNSVLKLSIDKNDTAPVYKNVDGRLWLMAPVIGIGGHIIDITRKV